MVKSTFGDLSTSQSSNTSIDGNDASENCAMSGMNNAIRALGAMGKSLGTFIATTGADTYLSTFAPVPDALATDFFYGVNFASANTSTTPTWNPSGLGPKTITDLSGNALIAGSLNGRHILIYDGTNFRVLNPAKVASTSLPATITGNFTFSGGIDFTGQTYSPEVALSASSGTITLDFSTGNNFSGSINGSITLANPTNVQVGQSGVIRFAQAAGALTISYGTAWKFQGGVKPPLTGTNGAQDALTYYVATSTFIIASMQSNIG